MKTSIDCLQWGQVTRAASDGVRRISPSQALHLKWMLRTMAFLLLLTFPVHAQTIADAARKERARQAALHSTHVYSGKGTHAESPAPAGAPKPAQPALPKPAAIPAPDPAAARAAEIARLRAKIPELEDQERLLQLQVNQFTNQMLAPVSDQNAKDQAQAQLGTTQDKLTAVRAELDQTKKTLDSLEAQGPPPKQ